MTSSKITMIGAAIAFLSLGIVANATAQNKTDAERDEILSVVSRFDGLNPCDSSKRAENICRQYCTGEGYLWGKGTCSQQEIWDKCSAHCRADWIEDCGATATNKKNNLKGVAQCK